MKLNFDLEVWVSIASLGLAIMFVLLLSSFYVFLVGPDKLGPDRYVDIPGVLIKTVSISEAPSIILAGIAFGLSRNHGNKLAGGLISLTGGIVIIGMIISLNISSNIPAEFFQDIIIYIPYFFITVSIGILIIGIIIYIKSKKGARSRKLN
ncbi:MAG: hypothetical protein ACE5SW_02840 [Nitrososphaeraceae archaeon]